MQSAGTPSVMKGRLDISAVAPRIGSTRVADTFIRSTMMLAVFSVLLLGATHLAQAQTEAALYNFGGAPDGANPQSRLTADSSGNLYGTTWGGGMGYGTVFELSPNGSGGWTETVLYNFCSESNCADGSYPTYAYVTFDKLGNLYGTAYAGGANGYGVVYKLTPGQSGWTETVLYNFCSESNCADGANPVNGLVMDMAGNLYGTTYSGGSGGNGSVFQLRSSGGNWTEKVIYNIKSTYSGLAMDANGDIYGTTYRTAFRLHRTRTGFWSPSVIFTFVNGVKNGINPNGTVVLDSAGNVYGTTFTGGADNAGLVYKLSLGTSGKYTEQILHTFDGVYGGKPLAGLVFDSAGNLFGTTTQGGRFSDGVIYEMVAGSTGYTFRVINAFMGENGNGSDASMIVAGGYLYGTTYEGGSTGDGVVFAANAKATATTTTIKSSPNPSNYGDLVTFTATVTPAPPDGEMITFEMIGQAPLSGGQAVFQTSTLPVGKTRVRAIYFGDLNFIDSRSAWTIQVIK
jgi:uncharacterized repeat protein (TIGR03803 family)